MLTKGSILLKFIQKNEFFLHNIYYYTSLLHYFSISIIMYISSNIYTYEKFGEKFRKTILKYIFQNLDSFLDSSLAIHKLQ